MDSDITAGALFSGIGGFCIGFMKAGIKTLWAVENDQAAIKTYLRNVENVRMIVRDIREVSVKDCHLEPVNVLHAGFPCQSFSQAGERKGFDDPRGKLFFEVIRIIREFKDKKPAVIVLENSPYLRHGAAGSWYLELSNQIKSAGYWFRDTNCSELDSYDLTPLPQKRKRLFMVAFAIEHFKNGKFRFPEKQDSSEKNLSSYINFSGSLEDGYYYLHDENRYFKMISNQIEDKNCIYQLRKYLIRVKEPGVCPTLTANMGLGGHNVPFIHDGRGIRKLTEYECLRLQGFPESFVFPEDVSKPKRYAQIGNSVVVPVAELIATAVREKITSEKLS